MIQTLDQLDSGDIIEFENNLYLLLGYEKRNGKRIGRKAFNLTNKLEKIILNNTITNFKKAEQIDIKYFSEIIFSLISMISFLSNKVDSAFDNLDFDDDLKQINHDFENPFYPC